MTKNKRNFILLILSTLIIISACVYCYVEQSVNFLSITIFIFGIFLALFSFKENLQFTRNIPAKTKAENSDAIIGSNNKLYAFEWKRVALLITAVSLSIVFLIGINYAAHRLPQRWDVTRDNQHTLSQTTLDFVGSNEKAIELTALYVGPPPKYLEDLLNEYARVSNGNIITKIIDPIDDIAAAAEFGNVLSSKESKLIATSGTERKDVDFTDASLTEEQVTNALTRVVREPRKAYFLTGHGEYSATNENNEGFSLFAELMSSNNITHDNLMLGVAKKIPDDCDILIIAGPRTDLTDQEQRLIERYLEQGGDALFLIENVVVTTPDKPLTVDQIGKNPSLNNILFDWGINVGSDIVVDLTNHVGGDVGSPATKNYLDHKAITQGLDYTFYIRPRSISVLEKRRATISLAPIVLSASKEKSWAETDRSLRVNFDEGLDIPGPVPISYIIWEEKHKEDKSDTRIIVFTDADFLSNAYLNQYSNAAMGLNLVNWLSELDYAVFVGQKKVEVERLDLTSKQKRMVTALLFLMPLLIALCGLFVWRRR